eukprot:8260762-Ditylum_brightwellii.AAC.1
MDSQNDESSRDNETIMSNMTFHFDNPDHQDNNAKNIEITGVETEDDHDSIDPLKTTGVEDEHHGSSTHGPDDDSQHADSDKKPT